MILYYLVVPIKTRGLNNWQRNLTKLQQNVDLEITKVEGMKKFANKDEI